ncbi:MgtC/SapB family protein [Solimonas terrae]|uniref:Protein MgtC n=1 Tax=Solimonas terrae TaxID=1396819 RepID=A0A6M2BU08_9GAMM|nr:MgtC/SapB family protein [Solimonas terrae]NGY05725.1 MgtC/SapB family protein [Solimonas terrae]
MLDEMEIVVRLLAAALFGGVIGFERERLSWAGLRTHMLVCVGAALFMIVSTEGFADALQQPHASFDPSRVAAQVASGIGFLGAGAILMRRGVVRGLTTAASLWAVAALGLAVGGGLYGAASAATLIMLFILLALKPLERRYLERRGTRLLQLRGPQASLCYDNVTARLGGRAKYIRQYIVTPSDKARDHGDATIVLAGAGARESAEILARLQALPGVRQIDGREP